MQKRKLGRTDTCVSVICLGTMTFGEQNTPAESHAILDAAVDGGVNFFDAAEMYPFPCSADTYGATETIIGTWLQKRGKRDDVIVATKISGPSTLQHPNNPPELEWIRGGKTRFNRANLSAAIDASLKRLQTDYIDLYQLHWPDRNTNFFGEVNYQHNADNEHITPFSETLAALADIQKAGKIRHIGLSNETPWGMNACLREAEINGLPRAVSVQNPYNLLNRTYEIGMAEISAREQCGLLPYSPLAFGALTGKYLNGAKPEGARLSLFPNYRRYAGNKAEAAIADYADLAKKRSISLTQLAIAFTIQQAFITSSIIGATTLAQLRENLAAATITIDDNLRHDLDDLGKKHFNPCP